MSNVTSIEKRRPQTRTIIATVPGPRRTSRRESIYRRRHERIRELVDRAYRRGARRGYWIGAAVATGGCVLAVAIMLVW